MPGPDMVHADRTVIEMMPAVIVIEIAVSRRFRGCRADVVGSRIDR